MSKTKAVAKKRGGKLPLWYTPAWSSRSISVAIGIVLLAQVSYYATESLGIPTMTVGIILAVSKIFDAVTDMVAGFIIDKTRTKLGKARPYELVIIPFWLCIIGYFSTPDMGTTAQIIWLFAFYTLTYSFCQTMLAAAETVYLGRVIKDDRQRGSILSVSGVLVMLTAAVASMILPQLMATWGTQPGGWSKIAMVYALPMTLLGLVRFFAIKELPQTEEEATKNELTFKEGMGLVLKNKYTFILALIILLSNVIQLVVSTSASYYFTWVIGDLGVMSLVGMVGLLGPFILLLFPLATRTIGAKGFVYVGLILAAIANVVRFCFPTNIPVVLLTVMINGIGASSITMMNSFFILQCIDYGELKFGRRIEGLPTAINNFTSKIGNAIGTGAVGVVLGVFGYVSSGAGSQTVEAIGSIRILYTLVPAVLCVLMLVLLKFFNVEKELKIMRSEK